MSEQFNTQGIRSCSLPIDVGKSALRSRGSLSFGLGRRVSVQRASSDVTTSDTSQLQNQALDILQTGDSYEADPNLTLTNKSLKISKTIENSWRDGAGSVAALAGAIVGTFILPGIGTLAGAVIGGLLGGLAGKGVGKLRAKAHLAALDRCREAWKQSRDARINELPKGLKMISQGIDFNSLSSGHPAYSNACESSARMVAARIITRTGRVDRHAADLCYQALDTDACGLPEGQVSYMLDQLHDLAQNFDNICTRINSLTRDEVRHQHKYNIGQMLNWEGPFSDRDLREAVLGALLAENLQFDDLLDTIRQDDASSESPFGFTVSDMSSFS